MEELHALRGVQLLYCSSSIIQHYLPRFKTMMSSYTLVIERAVDGATSILNEYMFYDVGIGDDAVTNIVTEMDRTELKIKLEESCRVILCYVVVVDSSTSIEDINKSLLQNPLYAGTGFEVRQGEWILTMVATYGNTIFICKLKMF
ncbi:uncharacterized protein LOC131056043 [Cryptomeria japonica]|uniref:uncharacterized protein LOC131056043 n=1 Tax=Cryptomeria japonica TaxID=3369 RepID=UPI0027D9F1F6|nr:uncharacterized protein LOC131056043 [Cryptomeria japonica]